MAKHGDYDPATLGWIFDTGSHLMAFCKNRECLYQTWPDVQDLVDRYGRDMTVPEWGARLVCSRCGGVGDYIVSKKGPDRP